MVADVWLSGAAICVAKQVDGVGLKADAYVGVDRGGDADVGVAEDFLDHDEFDALFKLCVNLERFREGGESTLIASRNRKCCRRILDRGRFC
ncbi:hypothetical protein KZO11_38020 [Streptomyces anulatus]|uniref:hypothetical protein n=1 Tax=Streptomyces anulatus TaxID=1892 RepID=UPI001C5D1D01|nr:hypothetical protein [Streptomyces anulatus]QYA98943.1 hypothetical protein KZO11_38020 [Streptomyces anulatus]